MPRFRFRSAFGGVRVLRLPYPLDVAVSPILTVDVEDWFHICGHTEYADPSTWEARESRVEHGTGRILGLLEGTSSKATFFVLGWIARKNPSLVRRIASAGHEIGSHGDLHRRVVEMTLTEFREDLKRSRDTLQEILGRAVTAYRAPEWSMREAGNPAFDVLVEEGFRIDSSLVAAPPAGAASNPRRPVVIRTRAGPILEVPPLMGTFFLRRAIWGGGVCMRMSRFDRVNAALLHSLSEGVPPVLYCHPWEFDEAHPRMRGLSLVEWMVKFAGRRRTEKRLARWLRRHVFQPISTAEGVEARRDADAA